MKRVSLTIDGKRISGYEGEKLLHVALENAIYVPNLCHLPEAAEPAASCRLCFVEIEGQSEPVTACTELVTDGMVVSTQGPAARRLARISLELLLASHPVVCARCAANRRCELQKIAAHVGVKLKSKRLRKLVHELPVDDSSPVFSYHPNMCVLCGRCVWVCRERLGIGAIGFSGRGFPRMVTAFGNDPIAESICRGCGECVVVCPVGALVFKDRGSQARNPRSTGHVREQPPEDRGEEESQCQEASQVAS